MYWKFYRILFVAQRKPTFMYTMPLSENNDGTFNVFWEETSLVGRNERRLSFEECKKRAMRRIEHHGINVLGISEEVANIHLYKF